MPWSNFHSSAYATSMSCDHVPMTAARQVRVAGHATALDREPRLVLDRPFVVVGHAHAVRGHVVHEEIGEVLGGDDDQRVGLRGFEARAQLVELRVERIAHFRVGARPARPVMPGAWLQTPANTKAHRRRSCSML